MSSSLLPVLLKGKLNSKLAPPLAIGQLLTSFLGTTQDFEIILDNGSNNYVVDWGDGNFDTVLSGNGISHIFATSDEKLLNFQPETGGDKVLEFNYTGSNNIGGDLDFSGYDSITRIETRTGNFDSIILPINNTLTFLNCSVNSISILDVTNLTLLITLVCAVNSISVLNITNLTLLINLTCSNCSISVLNTTNTIALKNVTYTNNNLSAASTDQVFIDLDGHGLSNGVINFAGNNGRTAASDAANTSLLGKGWTITGP